MALTQTLSTPFLSGASQLSCDPSGETFGSVRTGLDLVGGRMFAPGAELARRYADTIVTETDPRHRATQELIRDYVLKNFAGEKNGQHARVLFLIFRGPDAVETIHP